MARLRYNGLTAELGADLLTADTSITFSAALSSAAGAVPTISGSDYIPLTVLDTGGSVLEIIHLTAYTAGATTGTVTRAQESTTAADHTSGLTVVNGLTVADTTEFAASTTADTWHLVGAVGEPAFKNSWVNFGAGETSAGFVKDSAGVVHLRGTVKSGTVGAVAFTLPAGYRPSSTGGGGNLHMIVVSNGTWGQVRIVPGTGDVYIDSPSSNAFVRLDSVRFPTTV